MSDRIRRTRRPWCTTVTSDAVRHFASGIGDDNPLWHDPDHGRQSRWGGPIAPGCFAYAVDESTVAPGFDGRRRIYRHVEWNWFDVLRLGVDLEATAWLVDELDDGDVVDQLGRVDFHSSEGTLVATVEVTCQRSSTPPTPIAERPEVRYTGEEIAVIEQAIMAETRRGNETRWWENVARGEIVAPITKGPLSIMDVVAWCAGTQGMATDDDDYSDGGLHAETATGPQQVGWLGQAVTDWMGDDGFLHRLQVDIDENPPLGSTTTISGQVAELRQVGGVGIADLQLVATDQSGQVTASGTATVLLPSRHYGAVDLPLPGPVDR